MPNAKCQKAHEKKVGRKTIKSGNLGYPGNTNAPGNSIAPGNRMKFFTVSKIRPVL